MHTICRTPKKTSGQAAKGTEWDLPRGYAITGDKGTLSNQVKSQKRIRNPSILHPIDFLSC